MNVCLKLNVCISYSLILLSAIWFVFVIIINNRTQDPRINALNLISPVSQTFQENIYLRKIHMDQQYLPINSGNQMANMFQLIQIMNDQSPNILSDEAILIISITNEKLDLSSIKFAEYLYRNNSTDQNRNQDEIITKHNQIPIYILRQTEPVLITNQKYLLSYKEEIRQILYYFVNILDIKRLSILSFQIGALLTLYTLALESDQQIFHNINKVVLINPFNLDTKVFHSPPLTFVQNYIKRSIIQNEQRFNNFDNLRLLIISTKRTIFPQHELSQRYFTFSYKKPQLAQQQKGQKSVLYRFNNTVTISTRAMWNVFCFFDKPIYFFYQPFIYLLSKFFMQDSINQFANHQILYFFHYRELPQLKEMSDKTKNKYIHKCIDFNLENYAYAGDIFNDQCVRLLKKQEIYFQNSSILLYSKDKFQVYGQNYEKLYPLQTKTTYIVYHIQRMKQFRRLYIINRKSISIHLKVSPIFRPLQNPIISFWGQQSQNHEYSQLSFNNLTNFQIIRTCEPANLIFPLHFAKMARFGHGILFNKEYQKNCYTEYDNYDFYPDWFLLNWNILRNIMIFTLFCSHILGNLSFTLGTFTLTTGASAINTGKSKINTGKSQINTGKSIVMQGKHLAQRFYTQSFVNQLLVFTSIGSLFLFENFIILSTLCVFQLLVKYALLLTQYLVSVRRVIVKFMWLPVVLEILAVYYDHVPSSWKVLFLLLGLCISKHNALIILIKISFMMDSIKFNRPNIKGILSISIWTYTAAFETIYPEKTRLKKTLLDILFLFSMGICINEEGSVIDQITNAYIVMQSILHLNKYF